MPTTRGSDAGLDPRRRLGSWCWAAGASIADRSECPGVARGLIRTVAHTQYHLLADLVTYSCTRGQRLCAVKRDKLKNVVYACVIVHAYVSV